jgi:hypothetical protein
VWWLGLAACVSAADPAKVSVADLNQEVAALQTLHLLNISKSQMEALRKVARETAAKQPARKESQGSEEFRKALTELRDALMQGKDDNRIDKLAEKVEDLREAEDFDREEAPELTEEAAHRAPEVLRLLSASQVARYVAAFPEDIPDPRERLLDALGKVRGLAPKKWEDLRHEVSEEVGHLVAGIDADRLSRVSDQVVQLLIVARSLKDNEFKKERPELEKKARHIVGDIGPTDVLRNVIEQALAELLSNPRLPAALEARLK